MDARLVGEGVGADDGLVRLHGNARDLRQQPRGLVEVLGLDPRAVSQQVLPRLDGHDHLFHGGVAGPSRRCR